MNTSRITSKVHRKGQDFRDAPRIAVISDIHGNFEALKALPNDYDELWVLGDLVNYGPQPREVIDFVRQNATLVVRGNHDDAVAFNRNPRCSAAFRKAAGETRRYTAEVLSHGQKGYLSGLPHYRWVQRGQWTFYLCHAVPSDPLYAYSAPDSRNWAKELAITGTDFLFVGHTHIPFSHRKGEQVVVNPGSIGQPKMGRPFPTFAIWENGLVTLHDYKYAVHKTVEQVRSMPVSVSTQEFLARVLQTGSAPKSEKEAKYAENRSA